MSRKLDAEIAELLGWKVKPCKNWVSTMVKDNQETLLPRYSEDGNDMLELIGEMKSEGWMFACSLATLATGAIAQFTKDSPITEAGETIPEAVAKAAYKALKGEEWK